MYGGVWTYFLLAFMILVNHLPAAVNFLPDFGQHFKVISEVQNLERRSMGK
jgi:hypothetical protein